MPYEIENMNKLKLQIFLEHKGNWQDSEVRWARHNKFYFFLHQVLLECGVKYRYPVQRVQLVGHGQGGAGVGEGGVGHGVGNNVKL